MLHKDLQSTERLKKAFLKPDPTIQIRGLWDALLAVDSMSVGIQLGGWPKLLPTPPKNLKLLPSPTLKSKLLPSPTQKSKLLPSPTQKSNLLPSPTQKSKLLPRPTQKPNLLPRLTQKFKFLPKRNIKSKSGGFGRTVFLLHIETTK